MSSFPPDLRFVHTWRNYQQRVLEDLEQHLDNAHLHVVAAPGAGKTVLGLEVVRRLNHQTLVLVPSLTIRNQWIHHFRSVFVSEDPGKDALASSSLREPTFLTITTYQALHALVNKDASFKLPDLAGFGTLVLDEAHHLRNEWWKVLVDLKKELDDVQVIALTATPPYDVPPREWNRYFEMCGAFDAIISIPELVKEGNLCPHADFVYLSQPSAPEREAIEEFHKQLEELKTWLMESPDFSRALLGHPWASNFASPDHEEEILTAPETFAAIVIFLSKLGHDCSEQKNFLGLTDEKVPEPDDEWFEILLTAMILTKKDRFDISARFRRELNRRLTAMRAVERRRVRILNHKDLDKSLRNSASKIRAAADIFELENRHLRDDLRIVILTDYIRSEYLAPDLESRAGPRLGAVPIFEHIRESFGGSVPLALLTGSVIILPKALVDEFFAELKRRNPDALAPRAIPLASDSSYVHLKPEQSSRQLAASTVTGMFNKGHLRAIVGTVALLGEGWNAPATNTLVMASASSTYVQTNQVRGRAIRIDPASPDKVANIWHLTCVEVTASNGGPDFVKIRDRFSAFEGLSYRDDRILSGFERLFPIPESWSNDRIDAMNVITRDLAIDRQRVRQSWDRALVPEARARRTGLVEEVQAGNHSIEALQLFRHPAERSLVPGAVMASYAPAIAWLYPVLGAGQQALMAGAMVALTFFLGVPRLMRDWWQLLRLGMGPTALHRVARVVRDTLCETGLLDTPADQLSIRLDPIGGDRSACYLDGGTLYDSDVFIRCMEEILNPVDNPRYLLFKPHPDREKARLGEGDYHSVPDALSRKKEASVLQKHWRKRIGPVELVFTRRAKGRRQLLVARARAWVSLGRKITDRQSVWK